MKNISYVSVEGNIGAGKTNLATKLAAYYDANLIAEPTSDNPFLSKFYQDKEHNALALELFLLTQRYDQLKTMRKMEGTVISDYMFMKSKLFAGVTLSDNEFTLFKKIADELQQNVPKPDLLIYLHSPINKLKSNIINKGRSYEQDITSDYLEKIQNSYQLHLQQYAKVLMIEMHNVDFEQESHFKQVIDFLEKDYDYKNYLLTIE